MFSLSLRRHPQPIWSFHQLDSRGSQVAGGTAGPPPSWTSPLSPHSHRPLPPWGLWLLHFQSLFSGPGVSLTVPPPRHSTKANASSVLGSMKLGGRCTEGHPTQYRQALSRQDSLRPALLEPLVLQTRGRGTLGNF